MIKPSLIYDNQNQEFRQFGTTDGKTLLPIYVVGILLAILIYLFFHHFSLSLGSGSGSKYGSSFFGAKTNQQLEINECGPCIQQQIQQLQNQIQCLINQQSMIMR
jgi:hypothetical protein